MNFYLANNPDVMMPSYKVARLSAVFFIVFSFLGTFLIMNMLTAVIYNEFRGYLQTTLQHSLNRRQVAFYAAFHKLIECDKVHADESRKWANYGTN
jgi:two pore calcium channel protein 2